MKILWLSKSNPMPEQLQALREMYPNDTVDIDLKPVHSPDDVTQRMAVGGYDDCVAVVPWSLLSQLVTKGFQPLYPKVRRLPGGGMEHVGIYRVESVDLKLIKP